MKKIQTEKIELFARKYIFDIGIAAVFIFFALVLAERPKVDYRLSVKDRKALPAVSAKESIKPAPEKAVQGLSDFTVDEFRIQGKDVQKLYEAIKKDGLKPETINAGGKVIERPDAGNIIERPNAGNIVDRLNGLLQVADLFDKIIYKKEDLILTNEIKELKGQTEELRRKPFKQLKDDERGKIKRLNRLTLELAYAQETPKERNLEVRNIFDLDGNYEKPKELIIIPEKPYNLIAVLEGKEKRAILREYTGRMVSLKIGDKMVDDAVVIKIDKLSVTAKIGTKNKEYRIFDVKKIKDKDKK